MVIRCQPVRGIIPQSFVTLLRSSHKKSTSSSLRQCNQWSLTNIVAASFSLALLENLNGSNDFTENWTMDSRRENGYVSLFSY